MSSRVTLSELHRIKQWQIAHREQRPVEYHLWDAVLTVWVLGCVSWLPALALEMVWLLPLCALAVASPGLYVRWRRRAHLAHRLRCDWLGPSA
jgi:hypothetical protein